MAALGKSPRLATSLYEISRAVISPKRRERKENCQFAGHERLRAPIQFVAWVNFQGTLRLSFFELLSGVFGH